ncbi:MAG: hypothetical protein ACHREM_18380 [Polyangiales bacterium]
MKGLSMTEAFARPALVLFAAVSLVGAAACSKSNTSSGGGGVTAVTTSVNQSSNVSDLTSGDLNTYCHDVLAWEKSNELTTAEQHEFGCVFSGVFAAEFNRPDSGDLIGACKVAYETCLADAGTASDAGADAGSDPCAQLVAAAPNCKASVAAIDKCFQDEAAANKAFAAAGEANCAVLLADGGTSPLSPSSCAPLRTECPGLFGSSTADAGTSD